MLDTGYVTPADVRARLADDFPANYFTDGTDRKAPTDSSSRGSASPTTSEERPYGHLRRRRTLLRSQSVQQHARRAFRLQHAVGSSTSPRTAAHPAIGQPAAKWDPKYLTAAGLQELVASGITGKPEVFLIENNTKVPYSDQWNLGVRQTLRQSGRLGELCQRPRARTGSRSSGARASAARSIDPAYSNILISTIREDVVRRGLPHARSPVHRAVAVRVQHRLHVGRRRADRRRSVQPRSPRSPTRPRYGTPGTQDHRIVANGIVGLPWDIRLSRLLQYSSGDKFRIHDFSKGFCATTMLCAAHRRGPVLDDHRSPAAEGLPRSAATRRDYRRGVQHLQRGARCDFQSTSILLKGIPILGNPTSSSADRSAAIQFGVRFSF